MAAPLRPTILWTAFKPPELIHMANRCLITLGIPRKDFPLLDTLLTSVGHATPSRKASLSREIQRGLDFILEQREPPATISVTDVGPRTTQLFPAPGETIEELKKRIARVWSDRYPSPESITVVAEGREIQNSESVTSFSKLHIVPRDPELEIRILTELEREMLTELERLMGWSV